MLPAYNAARTVQATVADIPPGTVDEIILIDDGSHDDTVRVARELGITVIVHPSNRGYGGSQKTAYQAALETGADVIVMLHPDYQYDPSLIPYFVGFIRRDVCDVMLGCRIRTRSEALKGGMPIIKYLVNRALTITANVVLGQNLGEFHSGFRVYRRSVLERVPFERNDDEFVFDFQFLTQAAALGFRLGDAPMPTRYFTEASSIGMREGVRYAAGVLATLARFLLHNGGLRSWELLTPK